MGTGLFVCENTSMCPYAILIAFLEYWKPAEKKSFAGVFETEEEYRVVYEKAMKENEWVKVV